MIESLMGFVLVREGEDENGALTTHGFFMYFKLPPSVGDFIMLTTETVVVTARKWLPTGDLQIVVSPVAAP